MSRSLIRLLIAFWLGFALMWLSPAPHAAERMQVPTPVKIVNEPNWSRESCGATCVVTFNPGGQIGVFLKQVENIKRDGIILKIDGPCISACTMAADLARPNVCITTHANFQFHRAYGWVADDRYPESVRRLVRSDPSPFYSSDILKWVNGRGGFPGKDATASEMGKFLTMYYDDARFFFPVCN